MPTIDIALPDELMQALTPPACLDLRLPTPELRSLTLPIGGELQGLADFTHGIPTECSMNFSLILQLAPMMASMECLLKILAFFGDLVNAPTNPPEFIAAFIDGLSALEACVGMVLPVGMFCFVKDLLELIASILLCVVEALTSVLDILTGLQIQISTATAAGNTDLLSALQCSQENATTAALGVMQSLQPVTVLLKLAAPFMKIAGVGAIALPSVVPADDLIAMNTLLKDLGTAAELIKSIADKLPC